MANLLQKTATCNEWRPTPGANPITHQSRLPAFLKRLDVHATVIDAAPFIVGAGAIAHIRQIHNIGFTAPMSVLRNVRTLTAFHQTTLVTVPLIFACQAIGFEYRNYIPRWAHERERRRDESEVRQHIDVGMAFGAATWIARMMFRIGMRFWAPIDIVVGGAVTDMMHREFLRAHSM